MDASPMDTLTATIISTSPLADQAQDKRNKRRIKIKVELIKTIKLRRTHEDDPLLADFYKQVNPP